MSGLGNTRLGALIFALGVAAAASPNAAGVAYAAPSDDGANANETATRTAANGVTGSTRGPTVGGGFARSRAENRAGERASARPGRSAVEAQPDATDTTGSGSASLEEIATASDGQRPTQGAGDEKRTAPDPTSNPSIRIRAIDDEASHVPDIASESPKDLSRSTIDASTSTAVNPAAAVTANLEQPSPVGAIATAAASTPLSRVVSTISTAVRWVAAFFGVPGVPALPNQPTLAGLALLMRREFDKRFFNQAPTATLSDQVFSWFGQIGGTVQATDFEGDPITYSITTAPKYGTVEIDDQGFYTYTPGDGYTGNDSFTVTIADTGFHTNLSSVFGGLFGTLTPRSAATTTTATTTSTTTGSTTTIVVPVHSVATSISGLGKNLSDWNEWEITNKSSHRLQLTFIQTGSKGEISGLEVGDIVEPGGSIAYKTYTCNSNCKTYTEYYETYVEFKSIDADSELDGLAKYAIKTNDNSVGINYTEVDGGGEIATEKSPGTWWGSDDPYILSFKDAAGTIVTMSSDDQQEQADFLNLACGDDSKFTCSFVVAKDASNKPDIITQYTDDAGYVRYLLGTEVPTGTDIYNDSSAEMTETVTMDVTYNSTTSLSLDTSASVNLSSIVQAQLSTTYSLSVQNSYQYSTTKTITVPAYTEVLYTTAPAVARTTGDVIVTIGNTTWNVQNLTFDIVNTSGAGEFYRYDLPTRSASAAAG